MTDSEKFRLILAIILFLVYLAKRYDLLGKMKENKREKERLEAHQRRREERKEQLRLEEQQQQEKKEQTAEIRRRGLGHMRQKSIQTAGGEVWYLEGGAKPDAQPILLLHGFAADKEIWGTVSKLLITAGYHVVAPDLPGFGQNERGADKPFDVTTQAKRIRAFTQKVGLKGFHLVGHSMGGSIAAAIAYAAPKDVWSLTLIEPFGVHVPYQSELDKLLAQDRNPMVIAIPAAYDNLLGFVFHEPPEMPAALKKVRAEEAAENRTFYLKVWAETFEGERAKLLDLLLPVVKTKTLVLQGGESKVVHPSTPDMIASMMGDVKTATLAACGHLPMAEKPQVTARHLLDFLETVSAPPEVERSPEGDDPSSDHE